MTAKERKHTHISGLEIGVQEARKLWPDLSVDVLLALTKTVHGLYRTLETNSFSLTVSTFSAVFSKNIRGFIAVTALLELLESTEWTSSASQW